MNSRSLGQCLVGWLDPPTEPEVPPWLDSSLGVIMLVLCCDGQTRGVYFFTFPLA